MTGFVFSMKIASQYNNIYSNPQNKPQQTTFKGYFACPIKELHIQTYAEAPFGKKMYPMIMELNEKCGKYFEIYVQLYNKIVKPQELQVDVNKLMIDRCSTGDKYGQDNKLFTEKGLMLLKKHRRNSWKVSKDLINLLNIKTLNVNENIEGGNCFLGKKPNGENFAIIGNDALKSDLSEAVFDRSTKDLARALRIKLKNIHIIPQPAYHIDVAIRPLKYPYVLVNDMDSAKEFVETRRQRKLIDKMNFKYKKKLKQKGYLISAKETAANLKKYGFKPILIPGTLGRDLNFMNAIVHQEPDGSLIYITNHSDYGLKSGINMKEIFEKQLKEKCPKIKEVIYIDGEDYVPKCLSAEGGGIHCLTSERPDFEKWAKK